MCGIAATYNHSRASSVTLEMLAKMTNRGNDSVGIVSHTGDSFHTIRCLGGVAENFRGVDVSKELPGSLAVGHVRYPTAGEGDEGKHRPEDDFQPLYKIRADGVYTVAHNGNLYNFEDERSRLEKQLGMAFQSTSDTEIIFPLTFGAQLENLEEDLLSTLRRLRGSYSLVFTHNEDLYVARDQSGYRPLVMGEVKCNDTEGKSYVFASETTALERVGAKNIKSFPRGVLTAFNKKNPDGVSYEILSGKRLACLFEYVYFAGPGNRHTGGDMTSFAEIRQSYGAELFREHQLQGDIVIPVPDSGTQAAIGYSKASGIQFDMPLIKDISAGRTFIQNTAEIPGLVDFKHFVIDGLLDGREVIVIDDSLVRGNTSRNIVKKLRNAGAKKVSVLLSSPPLVGACYHGINIKHPDELIAAKYLESMIDWPDGRFYIDDEPQFDVDELAAHVRDEIKADYVGYLSLKGLKRATPHGDRSCTSCFTRNYPELLEDWLLKQQ